VRGWWRRAAGAGRRGAGGYEARSSAYALGRLRPYSVRELQVPLDGLEARLVAQRVHERVGFKSDQR